MGPEPSTTHTASATFEAACQVDALPVGHRARRLHGHSFSAHVRCALPAGWAAFPGAEVGQLSAALQAAVAPLDYALLNEHLPLPTDENLARWVRARLAASGVPGILQVGIQSTPHSGVDLSVGADGADAAHLWRRYAFQSAHQLPHVPAGHKCGRMHGHGFEVIVHAQMGLGTRDLAIDYDQLDTLWAPLHATLDHQCLNDLPGLHNPTSEVISAWLWQRLQPLLPALSWVTVYETGSSGANFDGQGYRIWKEFTLDSAVQLQRAPNGSALRRIHGHTYRLRLHLASPLHEVLGWTLDFGDIKQRFDPIFRALDHRPLYAVLGEPLGDATAGDMGGLRLGGIDNDCASLARWVLDQARATLPQLDRVDLFETRGHGAIVCAGAEGPALPV